MRLPTWQSRWWQRRSWFCDVDGLTHQQAETHLAIALDDFERRYDELRRRAAELRRYL
jgi:hypothetical protein